MIGRLSGLTNSPRNIVHHYSEPSGDLEAAVDLNWAEWPIHKFYRQVSDVSDVDWQAEWSGQVHE